MTRYKSQRLRLEKISPFCHWCKVEVVEYALKRNERPPNNMATIDHTISRFFRKKGTKVKKVLACHKCNSRRAKAEDKLYGVGAQRKEFMAKQQTQST